MMGLHQILLVVCCCAFLVNAFVVVGPSHPQLRQGAFPNRAMPYQKHQPSLSRLHVAVDDLTKPEQKVCTLMDQLHESDYTFRIVVVGNGAILETTSTLGPTRKLSQSPATGETILTLASADQSFEFHLKTASVSKVVITEKENPATNNKMRILRFLSDSGSPMCSLILTDTAQEAVEWFEALREEYGEDVQL